MARVVQQRQELDVPITDVTHAIQVHYRAAKEGEDSVGDLDLGAASDVAVRQCFGSTTPRLLISLNARGGTWLVPAYGMASMFAHVLDRKAMWAGAASIVYMVVVLPLVESKFFRVPLGTTSQLRLLDIARIVFAIVLFLIVYYSLHFIQRLIAGDILYIRWLRAAGLYMVLNLIVLALIWPGYWVWDEYGVLQATQGMYVDSWQSIFTEFYFAICGMLIPSGVGIVIVQSLISALAVGYFVARVAGMLRFKKLAFLLFVPFVFFPILLNNFYPLRLTAYSYLELLVLFRVLLMFRVPDLVRRRGVEMLAFTLALTLLAFWRAEGIFYLILLPVIFVKLGYMRRPTKRTISALVAIGCLSVVASGYMATSVTASPKYQVTASISPLSLMLQHPLKGASVTQDLAAINKVLDVEKVKSMPDAYEIPSFWSGALRPGYEAHLASYNRAFISLVVQNPGAFLSARMETFLSANGLEGPNAQGRRASSYVGAIGPDDAALVKQFEDSNALSKPINEQVRRDVVQFLLTVDGHGGRTPITALIWSIIPVGVLLFGGLVVALAKRRWLIAGIIALIFLRVVAIFLTAPANYFVYFLPVFISGWAVVFYLAVRIIDQKLAGSPRQAADATATSQIEASQGVVPTGASGRSRVGSEPS